MTEQLTKDKPKGPLVMAFIGEQNANRGDSKAAVGLSRLVAEMTGGQYVYVNQNMLDESFPNIPFIEDKLEQYCKKTKHPDIIIGPGAKYKLPRKTRNKATLIVDEINEVLARKYSSIENLVPHHLTKENLMQAGEDFKKHYPQVKGPLIAIMMGGSFFSNKLAESKKFADKLIDIASNYPEATFFLCPSHRTGKTINDLKGQMRAALETKSRRQAILDLGEKEAFNSIAQETKPLSDRIRVLSVDYKEAVSESGYNPYLGLLNQADHIIVAGESYSLVSEALFTGKNIYVHCPDNDYSKFKEKGYVSEINKLDENAPFPTRPMPPLDSTHDIAKALTAKYEKNRSPFGFKKILKKFCS